MTCIEFVTAYCEPDQARELKRKLHSVKNEQVTDGGNDIWLSLELSKLTGKTMGWRDIHNLNKSLKSRR